MYDRDATNVKFRLRNILDIMKYKGEFARENPTYFYPDGLIVFTGAQGSGKTLSAVKYVYKLLEKYPQSKLVTNIQLKDYPIVNFDDFVTSFYSRKTAKDIESLSPVAQAKIVNDYMHLNRIFPFNNADDLMRFSNDSEGVIYLIDEIQLYFNSLESKNINMDVMAEISQQRKQRKHIVATSQVFGRLAKPLREQFNTICACRNYFSIIQVNNFVLQQDVQQDGDSMHVEGKVDHRSIFIHSPLDYGLYDTYYKVKNSKFVTGENIVNGIYDKYTLGERK